MSRFVIIHERYEVRHAVSECVGIEEEEKAVVVQPGRELIERSAYILGENHLLFNHNL